jgi:hypothetical protein
MSQFYTVYKTTNILDDCYYLGVHKTDDPNDDYLGSGRHLEEAVERDGRENFKKEILFVLPEKTAFVKERELIEPCLGDSKCYNVHPGGHGGFDWINKTGRGGQRLGGLKRGEQNRKEALEREKKRWEAVGATTKEEYRAWRKERWKQGQRERTLGDKNPSHGTIAMHDPATGDRKRVKPEEVSRKLEIGWRLHWVEKESHPCPVCGNLTENREFCSNKCAGKITGFQVRFTVPEKEELIRLLQLYDFRNAGKVLGVSHMQVYEWAKGYGLKRNRKGQVLSVSNAAVE